MRPTVDWVLAGSGALTLLLFGLLLWWFGPWHAPLAFGVWSILTGPLLIFAYRRTRVRWLLYVGSGLIPCGLVVGLLGGDLLWEVPALRVAIVAVAAALPVALTLAWIGRFMRVPSGPQDRWSGLATAIFVVTGIGVVATVLWARAEDRRPSENPAFVRDFVGCYEVRIGSWIPPVMLGHAAQGIIPERLELDTTRRLTYARKNNLVIRPSWSYGDAWWLPIDENNVRLAWHNGFHGVSINMQRRRGELRGKAIGSTDVGGFWPESRALVRALPVDCSSMPADTVRVTTKP